MFSSRSEITSKQKYLGWPMTSGCHTSTRAIINMKKAKMFVLSKENILTTSRRILPSRRLKAVKFGILQPNTIGQRQGLGIAWSEPLYVVKKDVRNNVLYVGEEFTLYTNSLQIKDVNFLVNKNAILDSYNSFECDVCLRDKTPLIDAKIHVNGTNAEVQLHQPARAITPGQACVFYSGDMLLGGGEIV